MRFADDAEQQVVGEGEEMQREDARVNESQGQDHQDEGHQEDGQTAEPAASETNQLDEAMAQDGVD